jgi:hypothetical protein
MKIRDAGNIDDDTSLVDNLDQGLIELPKNEIMSIKNGCTSVNSFIHGIRARKRD